MRDRGRSIRRSGVVLAVVAVAACLPTRRSPEGSEHQGIPPSAVLDMEVEGEESGMLLDAMVRRIPTMRIRFDTRCPAISLRGQNTAPGLTDPEVYVDGLRGVDTCILNHLAVADVRLVEVYAQGVTSRPGYVTSPRGLILVFTRQR